MPNTTDKLLRDIIDIPAQVRAGDLLVDLAKGFDTSADLIKKYVVTPQLSDRLNEALGMVGTAVRSNKSIAAYLHGSFGSGKSHFMTVVHAMLNGDQSAREKEQLQPLLGTHAAWLAGRRFLMVPYHLIGAESLDAAVLGGYVKRVRELHPDANTPAVYRDDAMLVDARAWRARLGDQAFIKALSDKPGDPDSWGGGSWSPASLDAAFAAPPGDRRRRNLISDLLDTLLSSYRTSVHGDREAFLPLETGLAVMSEHAHELGYDAVVLFLDELVLWLSSHLADLVFVNTEANKLVKLVESADRYRPAPIVSFIARQRDISELVGSDVVGSEVSSLEDTMKYLERSFDTISLADNNLPEIARERVLKPRDEAGIRLLNEAFAQVPRDRREVWDTLLDAQGVTHPSAEDFRLLYPFSPALMNTLIAISGALQRERTGLKVLQEMLITRREDLAVGQLVPFGDLWDVLSAGAIQPFSNRLKHEFEAAKQFYARVRADLLQRHGVSEANLASLPQQHPFRVDDRLIKTLLMAVLAPNVTALRQLTAGRLAALNHGSIRTRIQGQERTQVTARLKDLAGRYGEIRYTEAEDPVFSLHLTGIDVEAILDSVTSEYGSGTRRLLLRDLLWDELGVADRESFSPKVEVVWRGTKRTVGLVFGNVRDPASLADDQFEVVAPEQARIIVDYPFDEGTHSPHEDVRRVGELQRRGKDGAVLCWLPSFLSEQWRTEVGRLARMRFLLGAPGRLQEKAPNLSNEDLAKARNQLTAQRDNLTSQLREVLKQVYGIARVDPDNVAVPAEEHVMCLDGNPPRLHAGVRFRDALLQLTDGLFDNLYPKHPDFDPDRSRVAVRPGDLRVVLEEATKAAEAGVGGRTEVERGRRAVLRRIAHPLRLGEMSSEAHFTLSDDWRQRINQWALQQRLGADLPVSSLWRWFEDTELRGADRAVQNLVIAVFALRDERAWVHHGVEIDPPGLEHIDRDDKLRARELPSAQEFERALVRAQHLCTAKTNKVHSARNVKRLADEVRGWASAAENDLAALVRRLSEHATTLGILQDVPRLATARDAANLVSRLARVTEPTALVRLLDTIDVGTDGGHTLGSCVSQANDTAAALERTDWNLLDSLRNLSGRVDGIGTQATQVVARLAEDAASNDTTRRLRPALERAHADAVRLLTEASRVAVQPEPWKPDPTDEPDKRSSARDDDQGPSDHADVPTSGTVTASGRDLEAKLREVRRLAAQRPDTQITVNWTVVDEQ
ncbi:PglY protein [Salinispora arenicola]|uniref:PglY protein n=1 Tax=Salinispora arenicola TaxID=168697 RepID=UPI0014316011|nr:PglY protein [Salinispora arenicola]NIL40697.1 PglY protein [Salinispora arenicola]